MVATQNTQNYTGITNANCYTVIQGAMANFVNGTSVTLYQSYTTASPYHLVYAIYNPNDSGTYNTVYLDYSINTSTGAVTMTLYETWNTSTLTGTNGAGTIGFTMPTGSISTTTYTDSTNSYGVWYSYTTGATSFGSFRGYASATVLNFANSANNQPSVQMLYPTANTIYFVPTARQLGGTATSSNAGYQIGTVASNYVGYGYLGGSILITQPVPMTSNNSPIGFISTDFYVTSGNTVINSNIAQNNLKYINGTQQFVPLMLGTSNSTFLIRTA
jgi:hypothetical protein